MQRQKNDHSEHSTNSIGKTEIELIQERKWVPGPSALLVGGKYDLDRHERKVKRLGWYDAYFYEHNKKIYDSWGVKKSWQKYGKGKGAEKIYYLYGDILQHDLNAHPLANLDFDSCLTINSVLDGTGFKLDKFFKAKVQVISTTFTMRSASLDEIRAKTGDYILKQHIMYEEFLRINYPDYVHEVIGYRGVRAVAGRGGCPMMMSMSIYDPEENYFATPDVLESEIPEDEFPET